MNSEYNLPALIYIKKAELQEAEICGFKVWFVSVVQDPNYSTEHTNKVMLGSAPLNKLRVFMVSDVLQPCGGKLLETVLLNQMEKHGIYKIPMISTDTNLKLMSNRKTYKQFQHELNKQGHCFVGILGRYVDTRKGFLVSEVITESRRPEVK